MSIMQSKAVLAYIEKRKAEKKLGRSRNTDAPQETKPRRRRYTPKDKARYAIEQRGGDLWMQKWIDWDDKSIPVGKRRVAFVRYLTMTKGFSLESAKYRAKLYIK